ncbi:MAG TPA: GLPGLI family protein [Saprospiraceae bacterium]|nr:GLPGLI family protein [Saprospiraceae bacterium]HMP24920.1 GLPGLI family protein [Saprospiraceae bacterium]
MKELFVLFMLSVCYLGLEQLQEGAITYEMKVNMHRRLPNQDMKNMIPEYQTSQTRLFFNANESFYKNANDEEDDLEISGGSGGMTFRIKRPISEIYRHFDNGQKLEQREFMGKKYLIEGEIKQTPWKVTGEMEEIAGYNCMKATHADSVGTFARNIVAWFTPDIPVPAGPDSFGSLPGMILKVDINEGEMVYTAINISNKKPGKNDLKAPSGGKKVTEEEFRELMREQMKQMGGQGRMMFGN